MREIVLDIETTGLELVFNHRIIEIGCVELVNHIPTGKTYQVYVNPQRDISETAFNIHSISKVFLEDQPLFKDIAQELINFIQGDLLIIHNADFDIKFLNSELQLCGFESISNDRIIDTLAIARMQFPGSPVNLDALSRRFSVNDLDRSKHGALLDSKILARVYIELIGGSQISFSFNTPDHSNEKIYFYISQLLRKNRENRGFYQEASAEEKKLHTKMLKKIINPMWSTFL